MIVKTRTINKWLSPELSPELSSQVLCKRMNKYKYHIIFLIVLIISSGYYLRPQSPSADVPPSVKSSRSVSSIKPAEVDESFNTWYLGDIAVDIPASMALDGLLQFSIQPDAANRNITIGFNDVSADEVKNKEYGLTSSEPLSRSGSQVLFWEPFAEKTEDVSDIIGSPSGLSIFYGCDDVEENRWTLGLDIRIKEDYGYLEFAFTELLFEPLPPGQREDIASQRKDLFLSWVAGFLKAYNWIGHNQKPGHKQLATRRGLINVEDTLSIINIGVMAFFDSIDVAPRSADRLMIVVNRLFYTGMCRKSHEDLTDAIYMTPANGSIRIYKEWALPIDSAIYGSICVTMTTVASTQGDDHEFQAYIMGLSSVILKSVRAAI